MRSFRLSCVCGDYLQNWITYPNNFSKYGEGTLELDWVHGINSFAPCFSLYLLRYRRSYDSDFTAPLVAYHVWPALMESDSVIVKGEAVTRRGSLVRPLFGCLCLKHGDHKARIVQAILLPFLSATNLIINTFAPKLFLHFHSLLTKK